MGTALSRVLSDQAPAAPRFIVDVNVGRLAKWLRVMGYDAVFIRGADDGDLLSVAEREGRVIVTRDRQITERRAVASARVRALLVRSDDFRLQMRQLTEELGLGGERGLTMCIECNVPLTGRSKQQVRGKVPPFVHETQDQFYLCPACGRHYWRGTHWRNMRREMAAFSGEG